MVSYEGQNTKAASQPHSMLYQQSGMYIQSALFPPEWF
jgi:hypothetical protein